MKKFVVIVDRNYESPLLMNAVGHLALGMGDMLESSEGKYSIFSDADNVEVSYLTDYPLIVLGAKSSDKLFSTHMKAIEVGVVHNVYYDIMFSGSVEQQLHCINEDKSSCQKYVAIMLFGDSELLDPLTKRISLLH